MSTTQETLLNALGAEHTNLSEVAKRHLIMNFTPAAKYREAALPIFVTGEHCTVTDTNGKTYFDGLAGLFCVQLGYSYGAEVAEAVSAQLAALPYQTTWSMAHPAAALLAQKIAQLAPGSLNRVFFTSGGGEANEAAIKMARQYHITRGQKERYKFIARRVAYHGTSFGAMSLNGMTDVRKMFEPLMSGVRHTHNTKRYRRPDGESAAETTEFLLRELESLILQEGADTIAAIIMEPLQNAGGSLTPPTAEYFTGVRELCNRYGILMIADEVITGYGRLGSWFGSIHYGFEPDMITFAKGIASAYVPLGGVIAKDEIVETILDGPVGMFNHALTYGGHPVACAAALKNLEVMERVGAVENVAELSPYLGQQLSEVARRHPRIVGDFRGDGFHRSFELVTDHEAKAWRGELTAADFVAKHLNPALDTVGLLCRVAIDAEGNPLVQVSPPLVMTAADIDTLAGLLDAAFIAATASAGL